MVTRQFTHSVLAQLALDGSLRRMRIALATALVVLAPATPAKASDGSSFEYLFSMGLVVRRAPSEIGNLDRLSRGMYQARILEPPQGTFDHDIGIRWRVGVQLGSPLFVLIEAAAGETVIAEGAQMSAPFQEATFGALLGVAGVRDHIGRTVLAVELAGGFRHVTYCLGETVDLHDYYTGYQKVVEIRARAEQRLSTSAFIGATLGTSLIHPGAWVSGLDVTFRPR